MRSSRTHLYNFCLVKWCEKRPAVWICSCVKILKTAVTQHADCMCYVIISLRGSKKPDLLHHHNANNKDYTAPEVHIFPIKLLAVNSPCFVRD